MPCYLAAHALFVQGIDEMLLQDWSGEIRAFPACPFADAAFGLRAGRYIVEGEKKGDSLSVHKTLASENNTMEQEE
ncbi:MAG: hypothetical protein HPY83_11010 [Anaerolineae bacterium]|nr:hypothetical protein [Anaerolineae bacterium]